MPPVGSQPVRPATNTSRIEVTSGGIETMTSDAPRTIDERTPPRRLPVTMPEPSPSTVAITIATPPSSAVLSALSATSGPTGRL